MRILLIITVLLINSSNVAVAEVIPQTSATGVTYKSETRETDYTIGSIATQHLVIEVPIGYQLDEGSIPDKAQTEAIELHDIHWQIEETDTMARYTFAIDWQIFVAFETVKSVPLRGLELVFKKNERSITVSVPPDSVLISSLMPPKMDEKHIRPYADVLPQRINTSPFWLVALVALLVLLASAFYIAWCMGWITLPAERNMPFRLAWRQIKQLPEQNELSVHNALKMLGQAVSNHAGYTVTIENLPTLCAENTQLQAYAADLVQFYQEIQRAFFAGEQPALRLAEIKTLAKQLSRVEIS